MGFPRRIPPQETLHKVLADLSKELFHQIDVDGVPGEFIMGPDLGLTSRLSLMRRPRSAPWGSWYWCLGLWPALVPACHVCTRVGVASPPRTGHESADRIVARTFLERFPT